MRDLLAITPSSAGSPPKAAPVDTGSESPDPRRPKLRRTKSLLPTLFTLGNLLCGFVAVFMASRPADAAMPMGWSPLVFAALFIFLGMLCDALDGRVARLTGSTSELGEQLDSMADMVSFGVAPAFMLIQLGDIGVPFFGIGGTIDQTFDRAAFGVALIYVSCAALRLARFNVELVEDDDHHGFSGLPTPAAAGTVASLIVLHEHLLFNQAPPTSFAVGSAALGMLLVTLVAGLAMVSRLPYGHLLNRYLGDGLGTGRIALLLTIVFLAFIKIQYTLAAGFVIYALSGPALALYHRWRPPTPDASTHVD
ncbi:MAG: CDP-diacylglycerol--serine O-phosphatidyltransferase [Planctomycetota bacterium]